MNDKIFPKGITAFAPRDNAPDFVLGTVIITPEDFITWMKENSQYLSDYNGKAQLRLNLTKSKDGRPSMAVDTWKPNNEPAAEAEDLPF